MRMDIEWVEDGRKMFLLRDQFCCLISKNLILVLLFGSAMAEITLNFMYFFFG